MSKSSGSITASGCYKCSEGELSELEVAAARRNFQAYDLDGDGVISREDFHAAMSKYKDQLGHRSPAELDEMYASVDIHGTGRVDFLTFAEMRVRKKNHTAATAPQQAGEDMKKKPIPVKPKVEEAAPPPSTVSAPPQSQNFLSQHLGNLLLKCGCANKRPQ
ncbi:hypothetical protein AB1Y20_002541 [Prymnesium parvum]|uniref:EF-hand domain-containing protein n=1 Tax=Prymnesium parvum TaxID=97485 RepID=A0AB34JC44_PRYPA